MIFYLIGHTLVICKTFIPFKVYPYKKKVNIYLLFTTNIASLLCKRDVSSKSEPVTIQTFLPASQGHKGKFSVDCCPAPIISPVLIPLMLLCTYYISHFHFHSTGLLNRQNKLLFIGADNEEPPYTYTLFVM